MDDASPPAAPPRYRWPWILLAFLLAGVVVAIVWFVFISREVGRFRQYRDPIPISQPTNAAAELK